MNNEQLSKLYEMANRALNAVKYIKINAANQITANINAGNPIKGWMIEQKQGNSSWSKSDQKMIEVCEMLGITDASTMKIKTPIQVLNSLSKDDARRDSLTGYLERKMGASSLVPDDGREAERVFGGNNKL
jgi:hypothetical protein